MKYIFFGSPKFATIILEKLINAGYIPTAVICNPDRPVGRKKIITPPPVKSLVMKHEAWNISILQPEKLDPSFKFQVSSFKPDVFIVAAYAKIIPKEILEMPRLGTIGVHPSLLPKYRGSSPIQSVILSGDKETGVTLYLMDEKMDHGAILASDKIQATSDLDYKKMERKLAELGADLLIETLPKFINGEIKPEIQNENKATYTKKFTTEDAFVDPEVLRDAQNGTSLEKAEMIERKIRALNPEPGAWTYTRDKKQETRNKRVKILEVEIIDKKLRLKKVQTEGKTPVFL